MKKKHILLLIVFLPLAYLMMRGILNYSGFCWAEKRWLSNEELISFTSNSELVKNNLGETGYICDDCIIEGVITKNGEGWQTESDGVMPPHMPLLNKILGRFEKLYVILIKNISAFNLENQQLVNSNSRLLLMVDNCGNPIEHD